MPGYRGAQSAAFQQCKDATLQWPANAATNEHFGNAGIYIFDRYEVQIIDPSKWGVQTGGDIADQGTVAKKSQLTPGGAYNVYWNPPAGGDPEFDENGKPVYGFVYNFKNRALRRVSGTDSLSISMRPCSRRMVRSPDRRT